jgi:drug/metabolite transporter (DMT)-like permease
VKIDWQETIGYIFIILASCFFGAAASLGKTLMQDGVSTVMLMQTRSIITGLILFPGLLLFGRKHLQIKPRDWWIFLLLGIPGIALVNASYFYAVSLLTVALAVFLQFTAPILVFVYGWLMGKENVTRVKIAALFLSLSGTYFMLLHGERTAVVSWIGVASAIVSTISYAFYVILSHELGKKYSPWTLIFFGYAIAGLFWCCVQNPAETARLLAEKQLWQNALLFSIVSTVIPFTLFLNGLRRVTPTGATIASTSETISATLFAYLFLQESLTSGQIAGAILIVFAIVLLAAKRTAVAAPVTD